MLKKAVLALAILGLAATGCSKKKSGSDMADGTSAKPIVKEVTIPMISKSGSTVTGSVSFSSDAGDDLAMSATFAGLAPNSKHGFHLHENADCSAADATSAGGHFNPDNHDHGAPDADMRHAGDLGNLEADDKGEINVSTRVRGLSLDPTLPNFVGNRGIILHADADDFTTQPTGNAGGRIACGEIKPSLIIVAPPKDQK